MNYEPKTKYHGEKHHLWKGGKPVCVDCGVKLSTYKNLGRCKLCSRRYFSGEKSVHWQGGLTPQNKKDRNVFEYKLWRETVFRRDNFTCQSCFKRGCELQAHHIKPFSRFPELRFNVDNGVSMCIECHKKTDSYKGKLKRKL